MALTGKQIQHDIWNLLRNSELASKLGGEVYKEGMRPMNSREEDAVVIFTAGLPSQIQTGIVTIVIYVPDIDGFEDGERTSELEVEAQKFVDSLTADKSNYWFSLQQTIATFNEPDISQHFISVKLQYSYFQ